MAKKKIILAIPSSSILLPGGFTAMKQSQHCGSMSMFNHYLYNNLKLLLHWAPILSPNNHSNPSSLTRLMEHAKSCKSMKSNLQQRYFSVWWGLMFRLST